MDPSTRGISMSYITAIYISAIIREGCRYRDNPSYLYFASKVDLYSANLVSASKVDLYFANLFSVNKVDLFSAILAYSLNMEARCTLSVRKTRPCPVISLNLEKASLHPFQEST